MRVYELRQPEQLRPRAHPWTTSESDDAHCHHDFLLHPERIRTVLEDFEPWRVYRSTETFFQLVEWLNGPDSALITNDCAFSGPARHDGSHSERKLEVSGRLMVLFRDLPRNLSGDDVGLLTQQIAAGVASTEPGFDDGILGISVVDTHFTTLDPPQDGKQVMLSFWAWGDDAPEAMYHLDRTLSGLSKALRSVTSD